MVYPRTPLRSTILVDWIGCIVLAAFLATQLSLLRDPGVGWHLKTGEWIWKNSAIPHIDPFLWGSSGKPWISNQWLSDLALWGIYNLGGFGLLQAAVMVICILPYVILVPRWMNPHSPSAPALALGIFLCMGLGLVQWYVRPVIFSFLFFAVTYWWLRWMNGSREHSKISFFVLPPVFALWANLHPAFPLGLLIIAISVLTARSWAAARSKSILFGLCLAGTLINPFGSELHSAIFGLVGSEYFMQLNMEWKSPDFKNPIFLPLCLVLALVLTAPNNHRTLSAFEKICFAIFLLLSLRSSRYIPFLGFVAVAPTILALQSYFDLITNRIKHPAMDAFRNPAISGRLSTGIITTTAGVLALIFVWAWGALPGWSREANSLPEKVPAAIIERIRAAAPNTKVFHTPNWGGFITWHLWPQQRAWIDDRNELNGTQVYEDFMDITWLRSGWEEKLKSLDFDYLLIDKEMPLLAVIERDQKWKLELASSGVWLYKRLRGEETTAP